MPVQNANYGGVSG